MCIYDEGNPGSGRAGLHESLCNHRRFHLHPFLSKEMSKAKVNLACVQTITKL